MPDELTATAADGVRLAVSVSGHGPPLLLIPGLGSARRIYDPLVPLLATRHTVLVHDQRGIGASEFSPGPYTMTQLAADAIAVLDAAEVDTACMMGASMGGMVAQHVALDHPGRVDRTVLVCTGPGGPHAVRSQPGATSALLGRGARTPEEAYRMACSVMYSAAFQRDHPNVIEEQVRQRGEHPVRPLAFAAQYQAVRGHDSWARLPELRSPTLVLHGVDDQVMPVGNGRLLAGRIPGSAIIEIESGSHLFFHEDPEQAASLMLQFLD